MEDGDDLNLPRLNPLTIQDLPVEAIFEVLKWIEENNLDSVQNVCRLWYSLIDEWKGRVISTSTRRIIHPDNPHVSKEGWALISEIGIRSFFIVTENRDLLTDPPPASPLPHFKFPHLLKCLFVWVPVHSKVFRSLVKNTINLSTLIVSFRALSELKSEHLEHLNFPQLKILRLPGSAGNNDYDYQLRSLPSLRALLKTNKFPRLAHLKLDVRVRVAAYDDTEILKFLVPFFQRHATLRELSLHMTYPVSLRTISPPPTFYLDPLTRILREMEGYGPQFCPSLKILNITGRETWAYAHRYVLEEVLKKLRSTSVEEVELEMGLITPATLKGFLSRNESTLKKLVICPTMGRHPLGGLDLGLFASMRCLRTLKIEGSHQLTGVRSLPSTLESISLKGTMRSQDVDHLLLRLPNLRKIRLDLGYDNDELEEGHGMRLETLQQLVENRKAEKLEIWDHHLPFPREGFCNGDPNNPTMLFGQGEVLHWELNKVGYYECTNPYTAI